MRNCFNIKDKAYRKIPSKIIIQTDSFLELKNKSIWKRCSTFHIL